MSKVVAFFDFDGTLTHGDSLLPFLRMVRGTPRCMMDMFAVSPHLAAYVFRIMRNDVAKEALLRQALRGMPISLLDDFGQRFAQHIIPGMLRKNMLRRLQDHQAKGHCCVLVSASLDVYLEPWSRMAGFDRCIASSLAVDHGGRVTGKLHGGNCHGDEKLRRIRILLETIGSPLLTYGYGDSHGDLPMLKLVNYGFLVKRFTISPTSLTNNAGFNS